MIGTPMENPLEKHWKSLENLWKIMEKLWKTNGNKWENRWENQLDFEGTNRSPM